MLLFLLPYTNIIYVDDSIYRRTADSISTDSNNSSINYRHTYNTQYLPIYSVLDDDRGAVDIYISWLWLNDSPTNCQRAYTTHTHPHTHTCRLTSVPCVPP